MRETQGTHARLTGELQTSPSLSIYMSESSEVKDSLSLSFPVRLSHFGEFDSARGNDPEQIKKLSSPEKADRRVSSPELLLWAAFERRRSLF